MIMSFCVYVLIKYCYNTQTFRHGISFTQMQYDTRARITSTLLGAQSMVETGFGFV